MEPKFPATSQAESKRFRRRNPAEEANMSHTQGDQAQGREEACTEWKRRGRACYISGSSYLHILLPICHCPPSPQFSCCLPANHKGRQSACFHTFHSQLPCTCVSSAPNSVLLPCPGQPPPRAIQNQLHPLWAIQNQLHPTDYGFERQQYK